MPVVVQDEADGRVLMVAYTDAEALGADARHGAAPLPLALAASLWRKGETSGNTLRVVSLDLDCDADAILATVRPAGPTCHRGTRSCFDPEDEAVEAGSAPAPSLPPPEEREPHLQGFAWLETLWATIDERRRERPEGSYTVSLLDGGVDAAGRKVTEEATEVLIAAKDDAAAEAAGRDRAATSAALAGEAADLLYHALVLLAERGQSAGPVIQALRARHDR